ncbi:aminoglycoside phosphotransferase family protein [Microbacterium murale]|uniref:Aminoglycoside phosphotransferase (APT) family kinase protein n=1 Tax=Microbacterium murale TaxID=1081040 RepID=A0ABU0PES2_9MICO|nr:aminoglycoside phosphotransferase family protein [Microbacterium murale]MDQ0645442.1 aminoglycoside phosphotransferase (APT) family kinase protein [Microbacterium murale]
MKMHPDQLHVDEQIVRELIAEQFPQWRSESVRHVAGAGTVNAIYRIGENFAVRFPLNPGEPEVLSEALVKEAEAMDELAAACPVPTPVHVAHGRPGHGYPMPWSVQSWLPGSVATPDGLAHSSHFAKDLVVLIRALREADTSGRHFAGTGRGGDLRDSDGWMETCFQESTGLLPVDELRAMWERFRLLPDSGPDRMTHGDLIPGNLLVAGERLSGVLDGGGFSPADPALDLVAGWHMLDRDGRSVLREGLGVGTTEWWRGAAWAFQQAMGLVWYYRDSNPDMSALGRSTLARILSDPELSSEDRRPTHSS